MELPRDSANTPERPNRERAQMPRKISPFAVLALFRGYRDPSPSLPLHHLDLLLRQPVQLLLDLIYLRIRFADAPLEQVRLG